VQGNLLYKKGISEKILSIKARARHNSQLPILDQENRFKGLLVVQIFKLNYQSFAV
jgi:hypothetical protein